MNAIVNFFAESKETKTKAFLKKRLLRFCLLSLILICSLLFLFYLPNAGFERYADSFLLNEVCQNPLSFHFAIADETAFHIDESTLSMPVYQKDDIRKTSSDINALLIRLNKIPKDRLSQNNKLLYSQLSDYLHLALQMSDFTYFAEPLSPNSGVLSQLSLLLSEYRLDDRNDIDNYFSILSDIPPYFDGIMVFEQEKKQSNLFMSDSTADKVVQQCSELMQKDRICDNSHFLISSFSQRLQPLIEKDILTTEEAEDYEACHKELLLSVVAPAYTNLADRLITMKGQTAVTHGLSYYENGREYYELLIKAETGSSRSVEEIKHMLLKDLQNNYKLLSTLLRKNPKLRILISDSGSSCSDLLPNMSASSILKQNYQLLGNRFPITPDNSQPIKQESSSSLLTASDGTLPCTVKTVDKALQSFCAPAFYLLPPIDRLESNNIYVNPRYTSDGLELFTTLAHEGYPGHMYQNLYTHSYWQQNHITPLKSILNYGGFTEGWAIYCELDSYRNAALLAVQSLPSEDNDTTSFRTDDNADSDKYHLSPTTVKEYYLLCRLNRQIQLALYSLMDIAIHYDNAQSGDIAAVFSQMGVEDTKTVQKIYDYIAEEPCNYLKYYFGYLEIMELKKQAARQWNYTKPVTIACDAAFDYRFHSFLLKYGPNHFQALSEILIHCN